jgi:Co/Zn/Cd efflux system component
MVNDEPWGNFKEERSATKKRQLRGAPGIAGLFFVIEVAGALALQSLALLADVGHIMLDVGALGMSYVAMTLADRRATGQHTLGHPTISEGLGFSSRDKSKAAVTNRKAEHLFPVL